MKNTLLTVLIFMSASLLTYSQDRNLGDFEDGILGPWASFSAPYGIIANPENAGINASDSVAFLDQTGDVWNGFRHWSDIPILREEYVTIQLDVYLNVTGLIQIYMDSPVSSGAGVYTAQVTGIPAQTWTTIEFDITSLPARDYKQVAFQSDITDTIFFDNIVLVYGGPALSETIVTRETFGPGPQVWDTDGPGDGPGHGAHWDWDAITTWTSENGHIEGGSDSSYRINDYDNMMVRPGYWRETSSNVHAHMGIRTGDAYVGSWDTTYYFGIDISNAFPVTAVEFGYARARSVVAEDTFHRSLNVEFRLDGGSWSQMDTSLIIHENVFVKWDYIVMPVDLIGSVLDLRFSCLQADEQIYLDDITVIGNTPPPAGTNDFVIENIVFGTVDDAADFTANLHMMWDADSIYMQYVIADDSIVTSGAIYQVDNLEIYFDLDNSKNIHYPRNGSYVQTVDEAYDDNDFQLRLIPGMDFDAVDGNDARPSIVALGGVKQVYTETAEGYTFNLHVAWDSLWVGYEPAEEDLIGFDVLISDNDATASDANRNQITYNSPTDKAFNDPSLWATLQLKADGRFELIPDEEAPAAPANFAGVAEGTTVTLSWDLAEDNIAVMSYVVAAGAITLGEPFAQAAGNTFPVADQTAGDHNYAVRAVDNYGLLSPWTSITVTVDPVAIDPLANEEFTVYPNPASSLLTVKGLRDIQSIKVISVTGSVVLNLVNTDRIDVSAMESGLYLIKVQTSDNLYSTTFVKE